MENVKSRAWVKAVAAVLIAAVSFFFISGFATSPDSFDGTMASLDKKQTTVAAMMATSMTSSVAISLIAGDRGAPISDKLADVSGYLVIIMAAIFLEKVLLTLTGSLAFKILIPLACLALAANAFWRHGKVNETAAKVICFAIIVFLMVPISVKVSDAIENNYKDVFEVATTEEPIEEELAAVDTSDLSAVEKWKAAAKSTLGSAKDKIQKWIDEGKQKIKYYAEAFAIMIVTTCLIPLGVMVLLLWLMKLFFGISIPEKYSWRELRGSKVKHMIEDKIDEKMDDKASGSMTE